MLYLVTTNNTWTNEPTTVDAVVAKGFTVAPSRRFGNFQIFRNGVMLGWLFASQAEQVAFLQSKGLI